MREIDGVASKLSESPGRVQGPAPLLGEHNREILTTLLGYSDEEVDKLYEEFALVDNIDFEYPYNLDIAAAKEKAKGGE